MIYLLVIVSALSLGIKIGIGTFGDCCEGGWVRCHVVVKVLGFVEEVVAEGWLRS
jgi:uncharacterized membrane protein YczE